MGGVIEAVAGAVVEGSSLSSPPMPVPSPASLAWLRLSLASRQNVPVAELVRVAATAAVPFDATPEQAAHHLGMPVDARIFRREPREEEWNASIEWLQKPESQLLVPTDPRYPERLRQIDDPPLALFCRGTIEHLGAPGFAIVGSRNASAMGAVDAKAFAWELAQCGLCIVSGLAAGIDAAAHEGALAAGAPTVAVMGTGPEITYPLAHKALADRIAQQGCVITEYAPGVGPISWNFPRRNRLISGLSLGVLVVEAAQRSGSLITARLAAEQGREVFAMPGSVHATLARGCHALLREGAKLVETVDDLLTDLAWTGFRAASGGTKRAPTSTAEEGPVLKAVGHAPISADQVAVATGTPVSHVLAELCRLQLEGVVTLMPGGRFQRAPGP